MVAWGWLIIAGIIGTAVGITVMAICAGSGDKTAEEERKWAEDQGLLYKETNKEGS